MPKSPAPFQGISTANTVQQPLFGQIGRASRPSPHVLSGASGKRQQRNIARLLDRQGQPPLMRCANAGQSPRNDSSTFGNKLREQTNVLIVDSLDLFDAELANLLAAKILAAPAASALAAAAGTPGSRRGTAFAAIRTIAARR